MGREHHPEVAGTAASPTERFAGYLTEVTAGDDGTRLRILIGPLVRGGDLVQYELVVHPDEGSMVPEGELVDCFDVLHEHPDGVGLDADARRRWLVARVADEIVARLVGSRVLEPVVVGVPVAEVTSTPKGSG